MNTSSTVTLSPVLLWALSRVGSKAGFERVERAWEFSTEEDHRIVELVAATLFSLIEMLMPTDYWRLPHRIADEQFDVPPDISQWTDERMCEVPDWADLADVLVRPPLPGSAKRLLLAATEGWHDFHEAVAAGGFGASTALLDGLLFRLGTRRGLVVHRVVAESVFAGYVDSAEGML